MKLKYISVLSLLLVITGCEDFLEKSPLDTVNTENFYQTADDAVVAINAAYQPLQRPKLHNMRMWTTDIIAGNSEVGANPVEANDGIETKDQARFITTTDNRGVLDLYQGPAPGILYANLVLQKVPGIPMDETLKNRILGEAARRVQVARKVVFERPYGVLDTSRDQLFQLRISAIDAKIPPARHDIDSNLLPLKL